MSSGRNVREMKGKNRSTQKHSRCLNRTSPCRDIPGSCGEWPQTAKFFSKDKYRTVHDSKEIYNAPGGDESWTAAKER